MLGSSSCIATSFRCPGSSVLYSFFPVVKLRHSSIFLCIASSIPRTSTMKTVVLALLASAASVLALPVSNPAPNPVAEAMPMPSPVSLFLPLTSVSALSLRLWRTTKLWPYACLADSPLELSAGCCIVKHSC